MDMGKNIILETVSLVKEYGKNEAKQRVLNDINLEIEEGEFVAIMGKSGAGKSTLLNILSTIDSATQGQVIINNKDIFSMKSKELSEFRRNELGFIFQDYNLLNQMTAYENITLPLSLSGVEKKEQRKRALEIAKLFDIEKLLDKYPSMLSGGEKQRVAAARAIIMNPKIVMADEPTGALDSKSSKVMMESLKRMNRDRGVTIVMVTHDDYAASYFLCASRFFSYPFWSSSAICLFASSSQFFPSLDVITL